MTYEKFIADLDDLILKFKNKDNLLSDAVTAFNLLWLGELLDASRGLAELKDDAVVIIDFRNIIAHLKKDQRSHINNNLADVIKVMSKVNSSYDLVNGKLPEEKKKVKAKNVRYITNNEIIRKFEESGLGHLTKDIVRITNAPLGASFNLERNYIILPEYVKKQVGESELKKIIFELFGNHAMLRFVDNIVESKESYSAMVVLTDGTVKPVILLDTLNKKQVHFKDIKKIMPIK